MVPIGPQELAHGSMHVARTEELVRQLTWAALSYLDSRIISSSVESTMLASSSV